MEAGREAVAAGGIRQGEGSVDRTGFVLGAALLLGAGGLLAGCATSPEQGFAEGAAMVARMPVDAPCPERDAMAPVTNSPYGHAFEQGYSPWTFYPRKTLEARQAGEVVLCVRLNRDGVVQQAQVASSSGFVALDGSALFSLGLFNSSGKIPKLPEDFMPGEGAVWLALPVDYQPPPKEGASDQNAGAGPCARRQDKPYHGSRYIPELGDFPRRMSYTISDEFRYPQQAIADHTSGDVLLCIAIDRASHLIDAAIRHSSGSPLLDGEALIALGVAQMKDELPKLPPSYTLPPGKEFMMFSAPIRFRL